MVKYSILAMIAVLAWSCKQADGVKIPSVDLLLLDSSTHLDISNIPKGRPSILVYYNSDCPHCQNETKGLINKMDSLQEVGFYFITGEEQEQMRQFNNRYSLFKYKNIVMGRDYKWAFPGKFKNVAPPYMVICDEDKRIRACFAGERPTSEIISFVNAL